MARFAKFWKNRIVSGIFAVLPHFAHNILPLSNNPKHRYKLCFVEFSVECKLGCFKRLKKVEKKRLRMRKTTKGLGVPDAARTNVLHPQG